jgi:hypothetical protein
MVTVSYSQAYCVYTYEYDLSYGHNIINYVTISEYNLNKYV